MANRCCAGFYLSRFCATDPVRRAEDARKITAQWNPLGVNNFKFAGQEDGHVCGGHCSHEKEMSAQNQADKRVLKSNYAQKIEANEDAVSDDSDFGEDDDDEAVMQIRTARFKQMGLVDPSAIPNAVDDPNDPSALPHLRKVLDSQLMAEVVNKEGGSSLVVVNFVDPVAKSASSDVMDGYLRQLAVEFRLTKDLMFVTCTVTPQCSVIMDLMLFITPALACFRNGQLVNRCVGSFDHVFPDFNKSPLSTRMWLSKSGMIASNKTMPGQPGDEQ